MRKLLLFVLAFLSFLFSSDDRYTLVISFDGFRYDYFSKANTPNFDKFIKEGAKAESLIPVFPSLTFPNHYAIATGYHTTYHRILGNSFYSKQLNKKYSMRDSKSVQNGNFYGAEPIWVTAEKNNINTATYFWIGSEAEIKGYRPSIYKNYDGSVSFESRVDSIVKWFNYEDNRRPRIAMLYFSEPDYTGHKYGTSTHNIIESIIEMDNLLGYTLERLSNLDLYAQMDIIIVSDHGMTDTDTTRVILLDQFIDLEKFEVVYGPTVTGLNYKDRDKRDYKLKNDIKNISLFSKETIPEDFNYINEDMPDYLLLADIGWFMSTSNKINNNSFPYGMHGYKSSYKSMHGIFIARGPSFKSNYTMKSLSVTSVYPLICMIHGIEPYKIKNHKMDWDIIQIESMLNQ